MMFLPAAISAPKKDYRIFDLDRRKAKFSGKPKAC
jgi:hypothetical protein